MHEAEKLALIVLAVSIGTSLLAGVSSVFVAMRSRKNVGVKRDSAVSILFGAGFLLTLLILIAAAPMAVGGMAYVGPLKIVLLLTAVFAVMGTVFGLVRGLRSGRAVKIRSA
jgi:hypothetical protein